MQDDIFTAVWKHNIPRLRYLLSSGADPNERYQEHMFSITRIVITRTLRVVAGGWSTFWGAVATLLIPETGGASIFGGAVFITPGVALYKIMEIRGINFNQDGWTPLHVAACCADLQAGRLLIEYGADVNLRDYNNQTPENVAADINILGAMVDTTLEKIGIKEQIYSDFVAMMKAEKDHVSVIIPHNKLTNISEPIGAGGFGVVRKARWKGFDVAVKELHSTSAMIISQEAREEYEKEIRIMVHLRHPCVVSIYGRCIRPLCIVMQYMVNGTLYGYLHNDTIEITWHRRFALSLNIARGLQKMHELHILHRDLKSCNVLLDEDYNARISDFGLSRIKNTTAGRSSNMATTAILQSSCKGANGTLAWMAPELLGDEEPVHTEKCDIYSLGIVLWEIASRKNPWDFERHVFWFITKTIGGRRETIPEDCPHYYADLIRTCWTQSPHERPTAEQVARNITEFKPT